jgi:hypothetical protein
MSSQLLPLRFLPESGCRVSNGRTVDGLRNGLSGKTK